MHIIPRIPVTEANLVSTNAPDDAHPVYDPEASYAAGDFVQVGAGYNGIWQSLVDGNTGHHPATDTSSPPKWDFVGPTNAWAMFDEAGGTSTIAEEELVVVVQLGRMNTFFADNVDAASVTLSMTVPGFGEVYNKTISLRQRVTPVTRWSEFFFTGFNTQDYLLLMDLPRASNGVLTVTYSKPGGTVRVGLQLCGLSEFIGQMEFQPEIGIEDYSVRLTNKFGRTTFLQGAYADLLSCRVEVRGGPVVVDGVINRLTKYRSVPVLYVGANGLYGSLIVYGIYERFRVVIAFATTAYCSLELKSLTS